MLSFFEFFEYLKQYISLFIAKTNCHTFVPSLIFFKFNALKHGFSLTIVLPCVFNNFDEHDKCMNILHFLKMISLLVVELNVMEGL